jgi:hypothetical protein
VQSVFSGPAVAASRLAQPITQLTSGWLRFVACPFLPSTRAILTEDSQLSTPKVGANTTYFDVGISFGKRKNAVQFSLRTKNIQPQFTFFSQKDGVARTRFRENRI